MELTAEAFRKFVESADGNRASHDRRQATRGQAEAHVTLMPFSDRFSRHNIDVVIRDLSRGGFGFYHNGRLPLGERFSLLLPEDSGRPIVIVCTVAYWQPLELDLYAIGARFCRVLRAGDAGLNLHLQDAISGEPRQSRIAS